MDPKSFRMLMYGLFALAVERDKQAHRASTNDLAMLCPALKEHLDELHQKYCERLDGMLERARATVDELPDPVAGIDDPAWRLLTYLTPLNREHDPDMRVEFANMLWQSFGQPTTPPYRED